MEIVQYAFDPEELAGVSKAQRRALGGITYSIVRRLGSPCHIELADDNRDSATDIMSPILPELHAPAAFESWAAGDGYSITANLPGDYRRRFPLFVAISYLLYEPPTVPRPRRATTSIQETTISCWPDRKGRLAWPNQDEMTGDLAVGIAVGALKRLHKTGLHGAAWHTSHNAPG